MMRILPLSEKLLVGNLPGRPEDVAFSAASQAAAAWGARVSWS